MRPLVLLLLCLCVTTATAAGSVKPGTTTRADPLAWPEITFQSRPWTRWWWLGNAVNEAEITRQLEGFKRAGFGGVEISPIYGAKGAENRYLEYLSPEWIQTLRHTVREGKRLGLGVDMIQGTGWPFGGPWVAASDTAQRMTVMELAVGPDRKPASLPTRSGMPICVMAYPEQGAPVEITDRIRGNRIDWVAPEGKWSVYAMQARPTGQKVKRAGPGGDGPVVDPFGAGPSQRYFEHFAPALAAIPAAERPRALFNDSFEAFGANWTADLFSAFQRRRGYDLRKQLRSLSLDAKSDTDLRVRADFRLTISELLLEDFTKPWTGWAHSYGLKTRNQAHGSPGNVLDLYAATDIPETEMFGPARRGEGAKSGWRDIMVCKLASSAAHVSGKPLTSSESMTWLGEHFQVSLADMKAQANMLFVSGVNHLFYHGTPFSPADAEWPGWLFYASTEVTPSNTWWRDLPALNRYIANCQAFLQAGRPDNDVLLYFPIHDLQARDEGSQDLLQYIRVHNAENWLDGNPEFAGAAKQLWEQGYGFDFVSDGQLSDAVSVSNGRINSRGGSYRAILIAGCNRMPLKTMERLIALANDGATVLILGAPPGKYPGLPSRLQPGDNQHTRLVELFGGHHPDDRKDLTAPSGKGRLVAGADLSRLLRHPGLRGEGLARAGLTFIRRIGPAGTSYFISNHADRPFSGWIKLNATGKSVALFDPLTRATGLARVRPSTGGGVETYLSLTPGAAVVAQVRTKRTRMAGWRYASPEPRNGVALRGEWQVEFIEGGPTLPKAVTRTELTSWADWTHDPAVRAFSGTARYKITFPLPERKASGWVLDLGTVHNSAHVQLNGRPLGTLFAAPYRVAIPAGLLRARNELEVEVTNLMANRIADLDRRKAPWQKFYFVNIDYKPFNAASWEPLPSGLLGPVQLFPFSAN